MPDFASYCRLVTCAKESDGKHYGYSGAKIGNAHLKWAFSEAAVLCLRRNPAAQQYVARLAQKHGKPKALTILAHKLARAVYFMLSRGQAFDATKFFPTAAARGHAMRTPAGAPDTTFGAAAPVRRATRRDDATRAGAPRPDREGGRYLRPPDIDIDRGDFTRGQ